MFTDWELLHGYAIQYGAALCATTSGRTWPRSANDRGRDCPAPIVGFLAGTPISRSSVLGRYGELTITAKSSPKSVQIRFVKAALRSQATLSVSFCGGGVRAQIHRGWVAVAGR